MPGKTRSFLLLSFLAASVAVSAQTYFPGRNDWEKRAPEEMGHERPLFSRSDRFRHRERVRRAEGSRSRPRALGLRARAVRLPRRTHDGAGPFERSRGPGRLHRRRVGRDREGGHDLQRHQDASLDRGRVGVRSGSHRKPGRSRERLRRARIPGSLRERAQPEDHLGPSAPADQRLGGNALGKTRLGGPTAKERSLRTIRTGRSTSPALATSTTTRA